MTWVLGAGGVRTWGGGTLEQPVPFEERCRQGLEGIPHVNHGLPCCVASGQRRLELVGLAS